MIDSEEDQQIVGQNYVEMSRSLDAISPMIYPSHYGPYNYQIPVPDAQPYDTVLAAMQASKMVLAGLDPKTGKKPVSADVSGNDAADAAADSQSTSGTTAVSGNDAAQDAEDAQVADGAQAAEDAAAKTFALSKEDRPAGPYDRRAGDGSPMAAGFYRDMGKGAYFLWPGGNPRADSGGLRCRI